MKIALIVLCFLIMGCTRETKEVTANYEIPHGLSDCKLFVMRNGQGNSIYAMRCPNSTTTSTTGKGASSTVVVDGVTYSRKENQQ